MRSIRLIGQLFPVPIKILHTNSLLPDQIIELVSSTTMDDVQALVLINTDVWRYGDDFLLQRFFSGLPVPVFVFALGYKNCAKTLNMFEVSWPSFYLNRPLMPDIKFKDPGLKYGFSCLNNKYTLHRLLLGYQLDQKNLLSDMVFSQNIIGKDSLGGFHEVILESLPNWSNFYQKLPIQWQNEIGDFIATSLEIPTHDAYDRCYANIVTESECESFYWPGVAVNTPVNTEKSLKPLILCQIPIYLAPQGHIQYIRSLGFEPMEDILPSIFDTMGTWGKIQAICDLVSKGKDWIEHIYQEKRPEILYNAELIRGHEVDQTIIKRTKTFIEDCLSNGR